MGVFFPKPSFPTLPLLDAGVYKDKVALEGKKIMKAFGAFTDESGDRLIQAMESRTNVHVLGAGELWSDEGFVSTKEFSLLTNDTHFPIIIKSSGDRLMLPVRHGNISKFIKKKKNYANAVRDICLRFEVNGIACQFYQLQISKLRSTDGLGFKIAADAWLRGIYLEFDKGGGLVQHEFNETHL